MVGFGICGDFGMGRWGICGWGLGICWKYGGSSERLRVTDAVTRLCKTEGEL